MQKEEGQIAHCSILARSRSTQQMLARFGTRHAHVAHQILQALHECRLLRLAALAGGRPAISITMISSRRLT
jgi:hypothetical protein